jgi:hypothetical protein
MFRKLDLFPSSGEKRNTPALLALRDPQTHLSVIHHRQNPLYFMSFALITNYNEYNFNVTYLTLYVSAGRVASPTRLLWTKRVIYAVKCIKSLRRVSSRKAKETLSIIILYAVEDAQKPYMFASSLMSSLPRHIYSLWSLIIRKEHRLMMFEDKYRGEIWTWGRERNRSNKGNDREVNVICILRAIKLRSDGWDI